MTSIRQNKMARMVQKELGDYFLKEGRSMYGGALITVTTVRMSPDFALARVYLSIFEPSGSKGAFDLIEENKKHIRHHVGQKIRNQVRVVPELAFFVDDSLDYAENIENLLKQ
jgi:ribosome-binding factor A